MTYSEPARTTTRSTRRMRIAAAVLCSAVVAAVVDYQLPGISSVPPTSPIDVAAAEQPGPRLQKRARQREPRAPRIEHRGAIGAAAGAVGEGATVFDDGVPGIANLDPEFAEALREAASVAADHGIELLIESGWRSPQYQAELLRDATSEYGSQEEAARWVATPETSAHVSGDAVDIGPLEARAWLSEHGGGYGLCQIYRNEPWHFELRLEAVDGGCPTMYADPTHDPRMQQ